LRSLNDPGRRRPGAAVRSAGAGLLIAALLGLIFIIADFGSAESRYRDVAEQSDHAHEVIDAAVDTLSSLKDAETGQRGFLITRDHAYLAPYTSGVQQWNTNLRRLKGLTRNNFRIRDDVQRLSEAGANKIAELAQTISLARGGDVRQAFADVERGYGKQQMDQARNAAATIVARERSEFTRAASIASVLEQRTRWTVEFAAAALFLLTLAGALLLAREVARERSLARDLEKSERRYRELATSLEEQVQQRTQELQRVNEELQAFTYSVSHDLRAPLRAIDGFSTILLEDHAAALDETAKGLLARIHAAVVRMGDLIQSLLDLSRVGRVELRKRQVSISEIATAVIETLRTEDPHRSVEIVIQPHLVTEGDPHLIRIVLQNLLSNAWKFTSRRENARIEVAMHTHDGVREFFVRDNGAGFDPAYASKLFKPFQRLHSEAEFEGTGIGLATAQRAVRRHGGEIRAESNGHGAAFYFTLQPATEV
jgi:signal transduction histidine kinase